MDNSKTLKFKLRKILKSRKITQSELAERTGISRNAINGLAGDVRQIRLDSIYRISEALEIEPGELFEVGEDPDGQ